MANWIKTLLAPRTGGSEAGHRESAMLPAGALAETAEQELRGRLEEYRWYHTIQITPTLATPGDAVFVPLHPPIFRQMEKVNFRGKRVLDIGCRDGLFCFEAERRGAAEVLGIDTNLSRGAVDLLIPLFKSRVQMREFSLYDLRPEEHGHFDIVLFLGVLYHLRYPFSGLKVLSDLVPDGGRMIIETSLFADEEKRALLFCPARMDRPCDRSSVTFFNRKGMTDSLGSFGLRTDGIDWIDPRDRTRRDGGIIRGTFLSTKDSALAAGEPHHKWAGGVHKTWEKRGRLPDASAAP